MTETLKHALHGHASAATFVAPDLDAIRAAGDRTLRRRRAGLAGGGLVAAGVVLATALAVAGDPAADDRVVAADPGAIGSTVDVSWVEGSTLHRASGDDVALEQPAVAYVRTTEGYVYADATGVVHSLTGTGPAGVVEVGRTDPEAIRIVADPEGTLAAWLDADSGEVVVVDQTDDVARTVEVGGDTVPLSGDAELTALDGATAYLGSGDEARRFDLTTGEVTPVAADGSRVVAAAGDVVVLGDDRGMRLLGPEGSTTTLREDYGDVGTLSPDGAWFSSDADEPQVVGTDSGERLTFDVPAFFATGYEWLDDTTLAMISQEAEGAPVELLTCAVPSGTCEAAAELGSFEDLSESGFVLPSGLPLDD
jgi:hypothetical protein